MIAFNKYYNKFNILSVSLVVVSLLLLTFKGLNFGIDFKGGTLIELRASESKINVSSLRDNLNQMNLGDVSVKKFGNETDFLIKFENNDNKNVIEEIKTNLDKSFGNNFNFRRVENVGPKVSAELLKSGIIAISVALILMLIYIWIRFEWQFSLGAILALFHDVIVTLGLFSLLGLEINLSNVIPFTFQSISFEYGIPTYSSKPCLVGRNSLASPRCHFPKQPVRYPFCLNIFAMVKSSGSKTVPPKAPTIP